MSNAIRARIFTLAKVMIAAAWADGQITEEEKQSLKDLLFHLPDAGLEAGIQMTAQDWAKLEMYMETPIDAEERERLIADLQSAVLNEEEKQIVISYLDQIASADGEASVEEKFIINEVEKALADSQEGIMDKLNRFLGGALKRRTAAVNQGPNREQYFADFVKNKVYYEVKQQLESEGRQLDLSDSDLRQLGLVGGLMARIAYVDREVMPAEAAAMQDIIVRHWQVTQETAVFITNLAISSLDYSYDYYRMTREFGTNTTRDEKLKFIEVLFHIAAADGQASFDETEEIRLVSRSLNLSHEDFINAKLTIPHEKR